jgi:hypothetical protein
MPFKLADASDYTADIRGVVNEVPRACVRVEHIELYGLL